MFQNKAIVTKLFVRYQKSNKCVVKHVFIIKALETCYKTDEIVAVMTLKYLEN